MYCLRAGQGHSGHLSNRMCAVCQRVYTSPLGSIKLCLTGRTAVLLPATSTRGPTGCRVSRPAGRYKPSWRRRRPRQSAFVLKRRNLKYCSLAPEPTSVSVLPCVCVCQPVAPVERCRRDKSEFQLRTDPRSTLPAVQDTRTCRVPGGHSETRSATPLAAQSPTVLSPAAPAAHRSAVESPVRGLLSARNTRRRR